MTDGVLQRLMALGRQAQAEAVRLSGRAGALASSRPCIGHAGPGPSACPPTTPAVAVAERVLGPTADSDVVVLREDLDAWAGR